MAPSLGRVHCRFGGVGGVGAVHRYTGERSSVAVDLANGTAQLRRATKGGSATCGDLASVLRSSSEESTTDLFDRARYTFARIATDEVACSR